MRGANDEYTGDIEMEGRMGQTTIVYGNSWWSMLFNDHIILESSEWVLITMLRILIMFFSLHRLWEFQQIYNFGAVGGDR